VIQHADLAGNAFVARRGERLMVLRPDWVTIVAGNTADAEASIWDPDTELIGYIYQPGGPGTQEAPILFTPDEVAHFAPIPDPEARFRGMSWLTPVIRELMADKAMTEHRLAFFENAATPNLVVKLDVPDLEKFKKWIQTFRDDHEGATNAYKTLYLGAGADATVVGKDLQQIDFKVVQGAGETRIAAAAGVPPVIVGLSEGLAAATYSNYGQARRRFNDGTMWPLWQDVAESLETIINVPGGAELCVDGDCIPALREDQADAATIQATQAQTIKALTDAGYEWNSVVQAVTGEDFTQLAHTGLYSVQLQPPGTQEPPPSGSPAIPATNGSQGRALAALEQVATAGKED
jgi:phage portal protein BeeE